MFNPLAWYGRYLQRYPLATQCVMTGVLFGCGDVLAQQVVEESGWADHQWLRTARVASTGLFFIGPAVCGWYQILERAVVSRSHTYATLGRVALDQGLYSQFSVASFLVINSVLEGLKEEEVWSKLKAGFWPALVMNWKVWTPIQLANFYLVPLPWRTLVVNTCALFWNTYMSNVNHKLTVNSTSSRVGRDRSLEST